jgi:hypothetical protein
MPKPDSAMFKDALKEYIKNAIGSHEFIHSSLPAIMDKPVATYEKRDRELIFTLEGSLQSVTDDIGQASMQHVEYRLNYATGEITSSEGHGVLHGLFAGIRPHFQQNGGINSMADLVYGQGFGAEMMFDQDEDTWRAYDPSTGIWGLAPKEKPSSVLARFLKAKLVPIQHLADFVGVEAFDWLSGAFAPEEDIESSPSDAEADDDDDDEELTESDDEGKSEDSECTTSGQKSGQKRKRHFFFSNASSTLPCRLLANNRRCPCHRPYDAHWDHISRCRNHLANRLGRTTMSWLASCPSSVTLAITQTQRLSLTMCSLRLSTLPGTCMSAT